MELVLTKKGPFLILQILAAHRCGIKRVILPERNLKDLVEVPSAVLANLEVPSFGLGFFCLYNIS